MVSGSPGGVKIVSQCCGSPPLGSHGTSQQLTVPLLGKTC